MHFQFWDIQHNVTVPPKFGENELSLFSVRIKSYRLYEVKVYDGLYIGLVSAQMALFTEKKTHL